RQSAIRNPHPRGGHRPAGGEGGTHAGGLHLVHAPELLPQWQREICPNGYYNLGLAHGVPGVIAVLGGAVAAGVRPDVAPQLLEGSVKWLLGKQLPADADTAFASWAGPGIEERGSRLAWCYG